MIRTIFTGCLLFASILFGLPCRAQNKKDTGFLTKQALVGVWQRAVIDGHGDERRDFPRLEEFFQRELKRME